MRDRSLLFWPLPFISRAYTLYSRSALAPEICISPAYAMNYFSPRSNIDLYWALISFVYRELVPIAASNELSKIHWTTEECTLLQSVGVAIYHLGCVSRNAYFALVLKVQRKTIWQGLLWYLSSQNMLHSPACAIETRCGDIKSFASVEVLADIHNA